MGIPEPKNLYAAVTPLAYFNWLIGLGVFQKPKSKPVYFSMILYTVAFWISYVVEIYIGISAMVPSYFYNNSPLAIIMYRVLVYTNTCVSFITPILAWVRRKNLIDYIDRIEKLEDTFTKILGFKKNYKKIVEEQIYAIIIISLVIISLTIADSLWLQSNTSWLTKASIMFTFHQPILLMLVTDSTFCGTVRTLGKKFRHINTALLALAEPDVASYPRPRGRLIVVERKITNARSFREIGNNEIKHSMHKRYIFQTIRRTHLELSKLTISLNSVFGIQNLISMAVSSVMITGLLYTIYSAFQWEQTIHEIIREVMPPASWCTIYAFKILVISYTSATVSDEAQKSGQIMYEVLGSADDKEFQKEIQEFALQMIQNPVRFTACGFFTLDHAYIQGVIGSITTYLVILIQMSNTSSTTPSPTNKTIT